MSTPFEEKKALRTAATAARAALTPRERTDAGQAVVEPLFNQRLLNLLRFHTFASYLSVEPEFPTDAIHSYLFSLGARICVPRSCDNEIGYTWAPLRPNEILRWGPHDIPEPATRTPFPASDVEAVLIPGLCFDTAGGRLGYGAGIYDRLLAKLRPGTLRVAIAFDCQLRRDPLPQEPHDIPMDYIVTESHWVDCRLVRNTRRNDHV